MNRRIFQKSVIAKLLESSPQPAFVLDGRRRCVYANQACLEWLSVSAEELAGQRCDYHSQTVGGVLCPPPTLWESETSKTVDVVSVAKRLKNGPSKAYAIHYIPLLQRDAGPAGMLGVAVAESSLANELPPSELSGEALHQSIAQLRAEIGTMYSIDRLVGESAAMRRVRKQIEIAIRSDGRVVVTGPPGSGREHLVKTLHAARQQAERTSGMVPLHCGLLDAELLRTTLTAFIQQCAELQTEDPPSLFLADVDRLPADAQGELEGFLSIGELGLRTIATTENSLIEMARAGSYRRDLAFDLSQIEIELPRLSERPMDVPSLAQAFMEQHNLAETQQRAGFDPAAMEQLVAYPWPGGVAELAEVVDDCVLRAKESTIRAEDLPRKIRLGLDALLHPPVIPETIQLEEVLEDVERDLIRNALVSAGSNKAEAARRLGISRNKLLRRMTILGL